MDRNEPISRGVARDLPFALSLYMKLLVTFTVLSVLTSVAERLWHGGWRYYEPLFWPRAGADFYIYLPRMHFLHHPEFFTGSFSYPWYYPAPGALLYAFFYRFCVGDRWIIG
jgi:hypothetical protein